MSGHPKKTPMLISKQNNTVNVLSVHHLDSFNSDDLFRDFNTNKIDTNKIEINSIAEYSSLNKAITIAKSKTINLKSKKE